MATLEMFREVALTPEAFVFSHEIDGSKPWLPDYSSHAFRALCRRAGLAGIRLHDLRHYVATRLLSSHHHYAVRGGLRHGIMTP